MEATITTDIQEQVDAITAKRLEWIGKKADDLLGSEQKREMLINLIEDFNQMIGCLKQIEKEARRGVKCTSVKELKASLVSIVRTYEPDYELSEE